LTAGELTDQRNLQSVRSSVVSENEHQGERQTQNVEHQLAEVIKAKDDEIDYLRARIRYLEEKRNDKQDSVRTRQEVVKSEKETSTRDLLESERAQIKRELSTENIQLKEENKQLIESQNELKRENTMLKEKLVSQVNIIQLIINEINFSFLIQDATVTQKEDKSTGYEGTIARLKEELSAKDQEIDNLLQERKVLMTKKTKLKSLLRQRDQFINELKLQIEEASKLNQNEADQS